MFFTALMIVVALGVLAIAGLAIRTLIGGDSRLFTRLVFALSGLFGAATLTALFFSCVEL